MNRNVAMRKNATLFQTFAHANYYAARWRVTRALVKMRYKITKSEGALGPRKLATRNPGEGDKRSERQKESDSTEEKLVSTYVHAKFQMFNCQT